jgi:molybdate transport system substrate-binding protein
MKRMYAASFALLMVAGLTACVGITKSAATAAHAATNPPVRVYSAGSLREALTTIALDYERQTGQKIELTFGASGLLRERIEKGEPAQVFTSADTAHPARLAAAAQWQAPQVFVRNTLCAIASENVAVSSANLLDVMLQPSVRLGTSTPKADPAGDYAWEFFRKADSVKTGSYAALDAKALKLTGGADSPKPPTGKGAYAWAMENKQADVFLLYCTNAVSTLKEAPALKLQLIELPDNLKIGAAYGLTVHTSAPEAAQLFAKHLLTGQAQATFRNYGFVAP